MIAEVHDGPGVLPGRYAGPDIKLVPGPTPQQLAVAGERAAADVFGGPDLCGGGDVGPVRVPVVGVDRSVRCDQCGPLVD